MTRGLRQPFCDSNLRSEDLFGLEFLYGDKKHNPGLSILCETIVSVQLQT